LRDIQSAPALGKLLDSLLWSTFGTRENALAALGWNADEFESWRDGTFAFDEAHAHQLAEAFDLDVPLFVGKALELTLRRKSDGHGGAR